MLLTLNSVYTESYWHINSTELTLHWTLHNTERTNWSEHYSHHDIPHHTAISRHFTPYAPLQLPHHSASLQSHSVVHPGHRHSTSYNIPFHIAPYKKYISSVASFNSAHKHPPILIWTLITLLVCVKLCAIRFMRVCVPATLHITSAVVFMQLVGFKLHFTSHTSHQKILHHTTFHTTPFHVTHHHCTTFHITLLHTNFPRHI